jgi:hypothetical protein
VDPAHAEVELRVVYAGRGTSRRFDVQPQQQDVLDLADALVLRPARPEHIDGLAAKYGTGNDGGDRLDAERAG